MILHINNLLNEWADWALSENRCGLGYPRQAPFTRLTPGSKRHFAPEINERAWETEQAVRALPLELRDTVVAFYCYVGTAETKADDLRVNRVTLYKRIDRAHQLIMDWLNDYYAGVVRVIQTPGAKVGVDVQATEDV